MKQFVIELYRSGELQKIVTKQTLKVLPKEIRQQYKKEGIPAEVQDAINAQVKMNILQAGINLEDIDAKI